MALLTVSRILKENGISPWKYLVAMPSEMRLCAKKYINSDDSPELTAMKKKFLPIVALYRLLKKKLPVERAYELTYTCLHQIAEETQSRWYLKDEPGNRSLESFRQKHQHEMARGLISHNKRQNERDADCLHYLEISWCLFYEAFSSFGLPELTEALCQSDEVVFNRYCDEIKFHRGDKKPDTIARGGQVCYFVFEKLN